MPEDPPINPRYIRVAFEQGESINALAESFGKKPAEIESLLRRGIIDQHADLVKANSRLLLDGSPAFVQQMDD